MAGVDDKSLIVARVEAGVSPVGVAAGAFAGLEGGLGGADVSTRGASEDPGGCAPVRLGVPTVVLLPLCEVWV